MKTVEIAFENIETLGISKFRDGRNDFFENNGITVLPNAVPTETYMYLYDEKTGLTGQRTRFSLPLSY